MASKKRKVVESLIPKKKKKKKGKGSLGEGKWDYPDRPIDPKSARGASKKPTPEEKAIAKAHEKTIEHSQEVGDFGGKRGSEKWLPSRYEEGFINPVGKVKPYTKQEKAYIRELAKRLEDAEKITKKGGGKVVKRKEGKTVGKPKRQPKKIKPNVGMSATFPLKIDIGVTAKKHGGKITSKMTGGQVVDAGYE